LQRKGAERIALNPGKIGKQLVQFPHEVTGLRCGAMKARHEKAYLARARELKTQHAGLGPNQSLRQLFDVRVKAGLSTCAHGQTMTTGVAGGACLVLAKSKWPELNGFIEPNAKPDNLASFCQSGAADIPPSFRRTGSPNRPRFALV
jgi:hypothetical protein